MIEISFFRKKDNKEINYCKATHTSKNLTRNFLKLNLKVLLNRKVAYKLLYIGNKRKMKRNKNQNKIIILISSLKLLLLKILQVKQH